jgi:hypothetical protein
VGSIFNTDCVSHFILMALSICIEGILVCTSVDQRETFSWNSSGWIFGAQISM